MTLREVLVTIYSLNKKKSRKEEQRRTTSLSR